MPVTLPETVRGWLREAREKGATHMLIITDTNEDTHFTMEVLPGEDPRQMWDAYPGPPQSAYLARECYRLEDDWDEQLALFRVKNLS